MDVNSDALHCRFGDVHVKAIHHVVDRASVVTCSAPALNETASPEGGVVSVGLSFQFSGHGAESKYVDIPVWGLYRTRDGDVEHGLMFRYPGDLESCNQGGF